MRDQENRHAAHLHGRLDFREPVLPCADTLVVPDFEKLFLAQDGEVLTTSSFNL